ncbi:hypothetical protein [Oryzihumus sp.]|uniref:hypothetical protein n=1 Tax=Oryzihumus sp. TaxID=1968903 RepID=UPI002ED7A642
MGHEVSLLVRRVVAADEDVGAGAASLAARVRAAWAPAGWRSGARLAWVFFRAPEVEAVTEEAPADFLVPDLAALVFLAAAFFAAVVFAVELFAAAVLAAEDVAVEVLAAVDVPAVDVAAEVFLAVAVFAAEDFLAADFFAAAVFPAEGFAVEALAAVDVAVEDFAAGDVVAEPPAERVAVGAVLDPVADVVGPMVFVPEARFEARFVAALRAGTTAGAAPCVAAARVERDGRPAAPAGPEVAASPPAEASSACSVERTWASSARSLVTWACAASSSATGTNPRRPMAASTSERTRVVRFSRLVVAAASSSSASVVTCPATLPVLVTPGRASSPWAASSARAFVSSPSPEASWT